VTAPAIALIAAVARNGVIGGGNRLLWKLPSDLARFRALTLGKPVVMGRKSFESIGRPLPGREMVIVTHNPGFSALGVRTAAGVDEAMALAGEIARDIGADEITVAGGGEIYRQTIARADRLFITEVALAPAGDVSFPAIDPARWREAKRERGARTDRDEADFVYVDYIDAGR